MIKTDHHIFLEGALGVRLLNAQVVSLHVEVPVAGISSQTLTLSRVLPQRSITSGHTVHHAGIEDQDSADRADLAVGEHRRRLGALLA